MGRVRTLTAFVIFLVLCVATLTRSSQASAIDGLNID